MPNIVVHDDPDTVSNATGKRVAAVHLVSPSTGLVVEPSTPVKAPVAGYVALTSPPAQTAAGADTALTFSSTVNHFLIQNNTTANVMFDLDTAATLGSPLLTPGSLLMADIPVTVLHLYTAAAQNVNGSTAGNIVVRGWA